MSGYEGPPIEVYGDSAGEEPAAVRRGDAPHVVEEPKPRRMDRDPKPEYRADAGHLPPQALEAEEASLGALMMSGKAIETAWELGLEDHHFYRPSHRLILRAIYQLAERQAVDELSVINELKRMDGGKVRGKDGKLEAITALAAAGGPQAVMTLSERCPAVANHKAYAAEVLDYAAKRKLVEVGHHLATIGYDTTVSIEDGVRMAEQTLLEVVRSTGQKHTHGDVVDTDTSMDRWAAVYERYHDDQEALLRDTLSWGRTELDERLGRMRPGQLFVAAGWTKHGKTWWCMDVTEAVMDQGARVLVDSGEMDDDELVDRWVAMGGHNYTAVQDKTVPWSTLQPRLEVLRTWRRRTTTGRMTIERIRSQVTRAQLEGDPFRLVVVDHLGLLRPGPGMGRHGRTEFLEDAVAELKAMAQEYGFTLLLVCQLSRPPQEKDTHPRYLRPPIQSDLKGASGIEQIATSVVFVYRQMNRQTGRFEGQKAHLLFPFHRSRPTPKSLPCEFVLPARPGQLSSSAYRFEPVTVDDDESSEPTPAMVAVQEQLEGTFGPLQVVPNAPADDDDIPF